jgi:hypothetical protein
MAGMRVSIAQLKIAEDYLLNYSDPDSYNDVIPSMVGLGLAMVTPRHNLTNLKREPPPPRLKTAGAIRQRRLLVILGMIHEQQHQDLINGALRGELNSNIAKLVLGKHNYHEKTDTTLSGPEGEPVQLDQKWTVEFIKPNS